MLSKLVANPYMNEKKLRHVDFSHVESLARMRSSMSTSFKVHVHGKLKKVATYLKDDEL